MPKGTLSKGKWLLKLARVIFVKENRAGFPYSPAAIFALMDLPVPVSPTKIRTGLV